MNAGAVTLRPITVENHLPVIRLKVSTEQKPFVASNADSLAQAYVYGDLAWPRAIYAGDRPVGFLMLWITPDGHPESVGGKPEYSLWRLMIDAGEQGKGYGSAAVRLAMEYVRSLPGVEHFTLSYVPKQGNPAPFYERLGFTPTGEMDDDEVVMRIKL
ncbi:MAG: GNAT family N-acetyltransferase [Planctomycetota bacterium]